MADGDLIINIDAELSGVNSKLHELSGKVDELGQHSEEAGKKGGFLENAFSFATGGLITAGIQGIGGALSGMFGDSIQQSKDAAAGQAQLDAVLQSTGGAAGVTKDQVNALVDSLSANGGLSTASDDATLQGENMLLTFTNIGKDVFPQATQTMLDMATAMNNGAAPGAAQLSAQAIQLGKALNDPVHGMTALQKVGVSFSDDQKKVIATMEKTGDTAGAQKVILGELSKEFGGSAAAAAGTFDGQMTHLGAVFDNVKQAIGDKLMPVLTGAMSWLGSPAVMGVIQGVADLLMNGLTNGLNIAGQAFQFLSGALQPVFDMIGTFVHGFRDFGENANDLSDIIGNLANGFYALHLDFIGDMIVNLGNGFGRLGGIIQPFVTYFQTLAGNFQTFFQALQGGADPLQAFIGLIGGNLGALQNLGSGIVGFIQGLIPQVVAGLQSLATQAWNWIVANGPAIVGALASWTGGFLSWAMTMIPQVLNSLGQLISGIFSWIDTNGPAILAQLGTWANAFINWVGPMIPQWLGMAAQFIGTVLGWIAGQVGNIAGHLLDWATSFISWLAPRIPDMLNGLFQFIGSIFQFIGDHKQEIIDKLLEWGKAFVQWVGDHIPKLLDALGKLSTSLGNWIINTALPWIVQHLGEWGKAFLDWIVKDVLPFLGEKLGQLATAVWNWITATAKDLGSKLVNEWIPSFWNWITGPGGVIANIGAKLGEIWTKITGWVGDTAKNIFNDVLRIGSGIVDGIKQGISNGWEAFKSWIGGLIQGVINGILGMLGIHSPSTVFADMGEQMVAGLQQGWASTFPAWQSNVLKDLAGLTGAAQSALPQDQAPFTNPANSPGPNALPGTQPGGALTGGDYPGNGRVPVGGGGGSNGGSRSLGFTSAGGGGGVNIAVYVDGARWSIERVAQEMGLDFRVTTAGGRV